MPKPNYLWALPAIASLFLFYLLKAIRWAQIIDPDGKLPAPAVFPSMMIGFAGNNLLPLRLGELVRIYVGSRDVKKSMTMITATLIVERVLDVISVLALISLAIQYLQQDIPELVTARTFFFFTTFVAIAASWIVVAPPPRLKRILDAAIVTITCQTSLQIPEKTFSNQKRFLCIQIRRCFTVHLTPQLTFAMDVARFVHLLLDNRIWPAGITTRCLYSSWAHSRWYIATVNTRIPWSNRVLFRARVGVVWNFFCRCVKRGYFLPCIEFQLCDSCRNAMSQTSEFYAAQRREGRICC